MTSLIDLAFGKWNSVAVPVTFGLAGLWVMAVILKCVEEVREKLAERREAMEMERRFVGGLAAEESGRLAA